MYRIQEFMKPRKCEQPNDNRTILPEIINIKFPAARNFTVPSYEPCMVARSKNCLTNIYKFKPLP